MRVGSRVIGTMAAILASRNVQTGDDLFGGPQRSPRTYKLIGESIKVVDSVNYPAHEGQEFHGNELQAMQSEGVHVTVVDKKYTQSDIATARNFCAPQK